MWITSQADTCNSLPALLGEDNLPLLWKYFSMVSPLWETTHQPQHTLSAPGFASLLDHATLARSLIWDESYISTETHHQIFKQAPGRQYWEEVKDTSWESEKQALHPHPPPAGSPQASPLTCSASLSPSVQWR